jgi:SAM-dependent methyltransferase
MDAEASFGRSDAAPISLAAVRARHTYVPKQNFQTEAKRPRRYRLRQARYVVLAQDIDRWAADAAAAGLPLSLLDVGCGWGPLLCQLEVEPHFASLRISGADLADKIMHRRELYREFFAGDLSRGYPEIASDRYDVVVCEQVLEHLDALDTALATLSRIVRPGGVLVIGVPIFFPPLHLARRHLVPLLARLWPRFQPGDHEQAFSLWSFRRLLRAHPQLGIARMRGFRIVSGGLLRRLEDYAWWWRLNRRLGELLPALCIEVQVLLVKSPAIG